MSSNVNKCQTMLNKNYECPRMSAYVFNVNEFLEIIADSFKCFEMFHIKGRLLSFMVSKCLKKQISKKKSLKIFTNVLKYLKLFKNVFE